MAHDIIPTNRKALIINIDTKLFGTFAEIGGGQEVARHFFQAGGSSETIAKTISAYDKKSLVIHSTTKIKLEDMLASKG